MTKRPPPPVIEGTLKEPIYALGFGMLVSIFLVNVGMLLTPQFFSYVAGAVFGLEALLWFLDKPKKDYEVYEPPKDYRSSSKFDKGPTTGIHRESEHKHLETAKKSEKRLFMESAKTKQEKHGKELRFKLRPKKNLELPQSDV